MRPQLFDLLFQSKSMSRVLRGVHRPVLERGVLAPQFLELPLQSVVFGREVFLIAFGHVPYSRTEANGVGSYAPNCRR